MININLNDKQLMSSAEACALWRIDTSWLRKKAEEFPEGTIRRFGKQFVVTSTGMAKVFGAAGHEQQGQNKNINLNTPQILSSGEACYKWGIDDSWLRKNISVFPEGTLRRFGKQFVVSEKGMQDIFGDPKSISVYTKKEIDNLKDWTEEGLKELLAKEMTQSQKMKWVKESLIKMGHHKIFSQAFSEFLFNKYNQVVFYAIFTDVSDC